MRKKIYIQTVDVLGSNFGTNIELAINHINSGDEVHMIICRGELQACPPNSRHDKLACKLCISKLERTLRLPVFNKLVLHEVKFENTHKSFFYDTFESAQSLKEFTIDGVNHGLEAASSIFTVLRDPRPDLINEQKLVHANLTTAVALYRWMIDFFRNRKVDKFYVLNGRYSSQMPAVRAAREYGFPFTTFEVAHDRYKYVLVEGTYFHDLEEKKREIESCWNNAPLTVDKEVIGHRFFKERRFGTDDQFPETQYKKRQERGRLPDNFDSNARNLVIYNSSEDEFAAVTGYENPVYDNQMVGLNKILNDPRIDKDLHIWLRIHPHLAHRYNSQTKDISNLSHPQLHLIEATDRIDTYALMERAEKVITFGSTMSVESAYAEKPSILIGREPYEELGCCYVPKSHDEVIDLINNKNLIPLPQKGALKFGYWSIAREYDYKHYDPRNKTLNDISIRPNLILFGFTRFWWSRYGRKLRKIFRLPIK